MVCGDHKNYTGMFKILFKFATRNRPQKFMSVINELSSRLTDYENVIILVSIDDDDITMNTDEIKNFILNHPKNKIIKLFSSNLKGKINATNRDIERISDWDILMNIADDFEFPKENIDGLIRNYMMEYYPDLDGVLHFPDGIQNQSLCTHPVMGRKYYDRFGFVFNPIYKSFYCDDELTQIAQKMNKITFINDFIYLHKHYSLVNGQLSFTTENMDDLDIENEKFHSIDKLKYLIRQRNNFNII